MTVTSHFNPILCTNVWTGSTISLVITHLDVLQQVVHVCGGQSVEEGVRFMHLHRQIIVFSTDVFSQQVDGLRSAVTDPDLRPASHPRNTLQMVQSHVCMKTLHVWRAWPQFGLMQVKVVLLFGPCFEMFGLFLSLQHLQLLLAHGLLPLSLQTQLLHLNTQISQLYFRFSWVSFLESTVVAAFRQKNILNSTKIQ